jgi:polyhydroxybutyrate depolymerase
VLCVDANRVFATGHSSGAGMTNDLGCQRGDVLRAIAPVAGAGPYVFGRATCTGQVAVWITHADNDESVDFSSGEASRDHWIQANGCNPEDFTTVTPPECVAYNGCDPGYPVHWCVHHDNHNWPDFATQAMWDFFRSL